MGESKYNVDSGGHDFYVVRHIAALVTGGGGRMVDQFYYGNLINKKSISRQFFVTKLSRQAVKPTPPLIIN